jgi:hypothetical protein
MCVWIKIVFLNSTSSLVHKKSRKNAPEEIQEVELRKENLERFFYHDFFMKRKREGYLEEVDGLGSESLCVFFQWSFAHVAATMRGKTKVASAKTCEWAGDFFFKKKKDKRKKSVNKSQFTRKKKKTPMPEKAGS